MNKKKRNKRKRKYAANKCERHTGADNMNFLLIINIYSTLFLFGQTIVLACMNGIETEKQCAKDRESESESERVRHDCGVLF